MRRSDRLFQIIQILRGRSQAITAAALAAEFELSVRTIYRDIEELQNQGVPIYGEAGIGYILKAGYDLPPLMLTPEEWAVVSLGTQWAAQRGDKDLARAARSLNSKIKSILPPHLRAQLQQTHVLAVSATVPPESLLGESLRQSIRMQNKLCFTYGTATRRVVWPIALVYFEHSCLLAAWCELRQAFRHFRLDRIQELEILSVTYPDNIHSLYQQWRQAEREKGHALDLPF